MNAVKLWLAACGLPFLGPCLRPDPGIRRLGAWSFWPLIMIRGPCLAHPLLMILSSSAMVDSCCGVAWLTSIVNFFIYPLLLLARWRGRITTLLCHSRPWMVWQIYRAENHLNELRLHPIISGTRCQAWGLELVAFFFHNFFWPSLEPRATLNTT